jgi:glycine cleavage system aminomethyltransferase T/glycine/D-amino acid oxidase-like deaminating enzyme
MVTLWWTNGDTICRNAIMHQPIDAATPTANNAAMNEPAATSSTPSLPQQARVVIVGGGIVGCSVAWHLTLLGWTDVVVLEANTLTSGTTWHAAGLVGQLRSTYNLTQLAKYSADLFSTLAAETGQEIGFRQTGSLSIALSEARMEELARGASMARCCDLEVSVISADEAVTRWPLLDPAGIVGAVHLPRDGRTSPVDTTQALARGARARGARIFEHVTAERVLTRGGRAIGVAARTGEQRCEIAAEYVVDCAGLWGRHFAATGGVNVPLHAAEHFYVVTESIPGLSSNLPVLRVPDICTYYKEEAGKMLVGFFEPGAKPWLSSLTPDPGGFIQLPDDWEQVMPHLERALDRVPALKNAGIQLFFNGPESFTPDDRYILGEAPELRNFFVAAGFNSVGIQSSGGAGKAIAEWMVRGHPPMDLWDVDIRRFVPFQGGAAYLHERTTETLGLLYDMHWPYRQYATARGVRQSVLHDRLAAAGACFGEMAGWERPNWYGPPGTRPAYAYSYGRQNWFEASAAEHRAVRTCVGLFDQSSFAKFRLEGRDAEAVLNQVCAADVAVPAGKIVYTQWLNERGGIEADLTVTRLSATAYLVVTAAATQTRDFHWLASHIPEGAHAVLTDITSSMAVLGVMGPRSRDLLSALSPADWSNAGFAFGTSREVEFGYARVRASRITYVGELGWELYIPSEFALHVYDRLTHAGRDFGLVHAGYHAMNSLRMEKAYRHWGHDISDEDTPLEAGLGFAVARDKATGFIGAQALAAQRATGLCKRLVQFMLEDPQPLVYHNEPIWRDGRLAGRVTSGAYGHMTGASLCMGYVKTDQPLGNEALLDAAYEIEIAGRRYKATASLRPFFDPASARVKA